MLMVARASRGLVAAALLLGGCATAPPDPRATCRVIADDPGIVTRIGVHELAELARGTPAASPAASAQAQRVTTITLGIVGGGALLAGLVEGFVGDPATQPGVRTGGYALAGGALGLFAIATVLGFTASRKSTHAREQLHDWARHCRADEAPPAYSAPMPPPAP